MEIKEEFVVQEPDNYTKTFKFPSKEIDFIDFINSFLQKFSDKMDIIKSTLSKM
jgi:hypothetical protein